ncbi:hypothetical protein ATN84_20140 [Paramesorhizobium deserti]|uniref:DegT/DnrJ/EryC1/StrS aminotransferase n=2 Tax=Paramesorhizobium deserti TaxID=1494590 RepID=A0A135HP75_9HYPH|nr:hypothetical protein ATN84_20140 [Paramesorhizobium deserti]
MDPKPRLAFVEDKTFSMMALAAALEPAIAANHHTNFGPVSLALENRLSSLNGIGQTRATCCTSNGTVALHAVMTCFVNQIGKRLRWAVSDFGFMTNFIGPLTGHTLVECREDGFISIDNLRRLDPSSYDAVLATNVFGLHENFDAVFDFCQINGKALMIDNAAGFRALAPYHENVAAYERLLWAETISLHHTKPWGMGEGGAVFLPASLLTTCRAAINFGVGDGQYLDQLDTCTNGKMSEMAAAQITLRVQDHETWSPAYREQAERIFELGRDAGLVPLIDSLPRRAVPGQIAFRSQRPVPLAEVQALPIPVLKYYRPGPTSNVIARRLYDHVVNVPSHGQMVDVPDRVLVAALASLCG